MVRNTVRQMEEGPARSASPPLGGRSSPALPAGEGAEGESPPVADGAVPAAPTSPLRNKNLAVAAQQQQRRPGSPLRPS